ncbi:MAG: sigma-70 family RNA polymerase sigma factor [Chloroflexota bacterium]
MSNNKSSISSSNPIESELVIRARTDVDAFGDLYEMHVNRIYSYIYYRTGNHHDAEDLTSKVFFKALQHIANYEERGLPFSAWLFRIAHNTVANWHRDGHRERVIALEDVSDRISGGQDPTRLVNIAERESLLLECVKRLPPDRQQLIYLKHVEGLTNQGIASIMSRSEGAIKSLYHRTLSWLRQEIMSTEMREQRVRKTKASIGSVSLDQTEGTGDDQQG